MKFEFADYLSPAPIIQEKKKYATFTVREIGGPAEIVAWRREQEKKLEAYQLKVSARDGRISDFEAQIGEKLAAPGLAGAKSGDWQSRLEGALEMRRDYMKPEMVTTPSAWAPYEPDPKPKLSLVQKFKKWATSVWSAANFS